MPSQLKEEELDTILGDLERQGTIVDGKWAAFIPHPSASPEREPDLFNDYLPKLRRGVLYSVRKTNQRLPLSLAADLQMSESRAPSSQRNTWKPDGGYVLRGEDWS